MMQGSQQITLENQSLTLLPQKALYWEEQEILVVSDVHFGKSGHFRKHGIAVPETVNDFNIDRLDRIIADHRPRKILFLGDLFHSDVNAEVERFKDWRKSHGGIKMILTIGNHDILAQFEFEKMGLECVNQYKVDPFIFMHDEADAEESPFYTISGHVHPAVKLSSKGRQHWYVPCFYFGTSYGMLPAFGSFTGNYRIVPAQNDFVYGVVEESVVDISALI